MGKKQQYSKQTSHESLQARKRMEADFRQMIIDNPPNCDECGAPTRPYEPRADDPRMFNGGWLAQIAEGASHGLEHIGFSQCTACGEIHVRMIGEIAHG